MARDGKYVVVYDIENNRERNRVSKTLAGYGTRVQKSVFECRLTRSGLTRLLGRLEELNVETGCVLVYRINENAKRRKVGACPGVTDEEPYAFVI